MENALIRALLPEPASFRKVAEPRCTTIDNPASSATPRKADETCPTAAQHSPANINENMGNPSSA
jgi:hypothetical protein